MDNETLTFKKNKEDYSDLSSNRNIKPYFRILYIR